MVRLRSPLKLLRHRRQPHVNRAQQQFLWFQCPFFKSRNAIGSRAYQFCPSRVRVCAEPELEPYFLKGGWSRGSGSSNQILKKARQFSGNILVTLNVKRLQLNKPGFRERKEKDYDLSICIVDDSLMVQILKLAFLHLSSSWIKK